MFDVKDLKVGGGGFALAIGENGMLLPIYRVPSHPGTHFPSGRRENSMSDGKVNLFHLAVGKLGRERLMGGIISGHDHKSAGFLVEAMHDAWALLSADA